MRIKFITVLIILLLNGCSSNQAAHDHDNPMLDLNSDRKQDVFYEYDSSGYYELVDRNFDGRVDESHRYNEKK